MFYINSINKLAYLDSLNIKVFPSGRRRSELLDVNNQTEKRHIPIDPEARLNTEANHRKHSGLNGYKHRYILKWTDESILVVLAGYLFEIKLSDAFIPSVENGTKDKNSDQLIGEYLAANLKNNSGNSVVADKIYVNILTTDVTFFSSVDGTSNVDSEVSTEILRDQTFNDDPITYLDLLKADAPQDKAASYYFSGLSFSAEPLEEIKKPLPANTHPFSLPILTKASDGWHICESSRLPKIDHGDAPDSVRILGDLVVDGDIDAEGDVNVDGTLTASDIMIGDMKAITLEVVQTHKAEAGVAGDKDKWQLCFNNAKVSPLE